MLKKLLLTLTILSTCQSVVSLELLKGGEFEVCQDLFEFYVKDNDQYLEPRFLIGKNEGRFEILESNEQKKYLARKLLIQASSYRYKNFEKWRHTINEIEGIYNNENLEVKIIHVDANTNGKVDRLLSISWKDDGKKFWNYVNFALDNDENLNRNYFSGGLPSSHSGEVFLYDGRTYSLTRLGGDVTVYGYAPYPTDIKTGMVKKGGICIFR